MHVRERQRSAMTALLLVTAAASATAGPPLPHIKELRSVGGVLDTVLDLGPGWLTIPEAGTNFSTRLYNRTSPGPTLIIKPGDNIRILLRNNLGAEGLDQSPLDSYRHPNATSLHLHGLHISPRKPEDDVITPTHPGENYAHAYHLPRDHAPGLYWYHPHLHGSTALQVMGGALGAIIVEDDTNLWYSSFSSRLAIIQYLETDGTDPLAVNKFSLQNIATASGDKLLSGLLPSHNVITVNGALDPSIDLAVCENFVLKVAFASAVSWLNLTLLDANAGPGAVPGSGCAASCSVSLLARDGIPLAKSPRPVGAVYIPPGGRADLLIRCEQPCPGGIQLASWGPLPSADVFSPQTRPVLSFNVHSSTSGCDAAVGPRSQSWSPRRPTWPSSAYPVRGYLDDLRSEPVAAADRWRIDTLPGGQCRPAGTLPPPGGCCFSVTSPRVSSAPGPYRGLSDFRAVILMHATQEVTITGVDSHPIHFHTVPLQLHRLPNASVLGGPGSYYSVSAPGNFEEGDWMDLATVPGAARHDVVYRFRSDRYRGVELVHCHILPHEDMGCMFLAVMRPSEESPASAGWSGESGNVQRLLGIVVLSAAAGWLVYMRPWRKRYL
eukprot:Hpha_TRINITY_DN23451_c0_g1::TRINITY_DN23451_c0_g1_i1::g.114030::m.114030